jgi:TatA/E family protein of Tat protein translocase
LFGLGGAEIALILLFGFLIFGPDKLPAIARTVGRAIRQFRTAQEQMNKVIQAEVYDPLKDIEPLANPFSGLNLDGSGDTKSAAKKDKATSGSSTTTATSQASNDSKKEVPGEKITKDALRAARAADASKAKEQAQARLAKTATASKEGAESFAERRAQLEKAHAEAKAKQKAPEASASTGTPAAEASAPVAAASPAPSTAPNVEE